MCVKGKVKQVTITLPSCCGSDVIEVIIRFLLPLLRGLGRRLLISVTGMGRQDTRALPSLFLLADSLGCGVIIEGVTRVLLPLVTCVVSAGELINVKAGNAEDYGCECEVCVCGGGERMTRWIPFRSRSLFVLR